MVLKEAEAILIQYAFCQIQRIYPYGLLAGHSVCVGFKKNQVFVHSPGSVNGKQTYSTQHYSSYQKQGGRAAMIWHMLT